jgi:hypothetical protein
MSNYVQNIEKLKTKEIGTNWKNCTMDEITSFENFIYFSN